MKRVLTSVPSLSSQQKIPPNFVNTAELNVPGHTVKDRYKTILPSQCLTCSSLLTASPSRRRPLHHSALFLDPETRVILRSLEEEPGPDHYINANYIRVSVTPVSPGF